MDNRTLLKNIFTLIPGQGKTYAFGILLGLFMAIPLKVHGVGENSADYIATPPFLSESAGKPNVIISLDTSGSMKIPAYGQTGVKWDRDLHTNFDPTYNYYGYFDPTKYYIYDTHPQKRFFIEDPAGAKTPANWSGKFLNWLTMRRFDVVRKVLVGGKLRNRTPELIDGDYWYVLLGQREAHDRTYIKSYSNSIAYTPDIYPNDTVFEVADGKILPATSGAGGQVQVINVQDTAGSSMEVGMVTMDWTVGDPWVDVSFVNTYSTAPVVVAKPLTFEGSHESITRVQNVTSTGFQIRIQEWDYRDGNHTTETLFYVVADSGTYDVPLAGVSNLRVDAGRISAMSTMCFSGTQHQAIGPFLSNPIVFTGISTFKEADAVVTRNQNVTIGGFDICLQEQKTKNSASEAHAAEDIHYVAVAPGNAAATLPVSGLTVSTSSQIELGDSGGVNMSEAWRTFTFASPFGEPPAVVMDMQTFGGSDPATLRVADKKWSETQIDARVEEENSDGSGLDHPGLERVGYLAVGGVGVYNIHLAIEETDTVAKPNEPKGLLQALDGKMRLGLAVFNYTHNVSPTSIYNPPSSDEKKSFDGGTFYPCYPDVSKPTSERTNWDICLETGVKAPLSNMVEVIEDHPLVWATTPIAETLYNIGQYVAQGQYDANGDDSPDAGPLNGAPWPVSESRQGYPTAPSPAHSPLYANNDGSTPHPNTGAHPPFQVNNSWDPYYYNEFAKKIPCGKTFVLHFNDGAPYTDWDTNSSDPSKGFSVPSDFVSLDPDTNYDENDALDDVALMFRNHDLRADLVGHQEIISYYVLAALGADPSDIGSTERNRLMEAAANGGFNDLDLDHMPDPAHPSNFVNYITNNAGVCTPNEWDEDGDCTPDTFYFASDGYQLEAELLAAFTSILKRTSSGGAASVLSGSTSGEGAIYQALFQQELIGDGGTSANWTGDVTALFIDNAGYLREDTNGNAVLEDSGTDKIVDMCFDDAPDEKQVRVHKATDPTGRPTPTQFKTCSDTVFTKDLTDVKYLWSGGRWLADDANLDPVNQRVYSSTTDKRHIVSAIDTDGDDLIHGTEQVEFVPASFSDSNAGLLQAADAAEAGKTVNYTRGLDQAGYRSRAVTLDSTSLTWRIGDIIHSSPVAVGPPAEDYDLIYGTNTFGSTYNKFRWEYLDRRVVIFAGGNDGMLHAFNGGYFDPPNHRYLNKPPSASANYDLGAELWAYVPYNVLPHLKYLAGLNYGKNDGDHIYLVDFEPRVFDAKIFNDATTGVAGGVDGQASAEHPWGWGTILVGAMRFGAGPVQVDVDTTSPGSDQRTLRSSFFIMDITNPEQPPQVLFEYTTGDQGFTLSTPTPILKNAGAEWYLLLGSGPHVSADLPEGLRQAVSTQRAKLTLLDLKSMSLKTDFGSSGILELPDDYSFVTGTLPVDYNLDMDTDAVYFGTVSGTGPSGGAPFGGKLYRLTIKDGSGYKAVSSWAAVTLLDVNDPITAIPNATVDTLGNRWIYVGTGRFLVSNDAVDTDVQAIYGVKEERDSNGVFTWGSVAINEMANVTGIKVYEGGALSATVTVPGTAPNATTYGGLETAMTLYHDNSGWYRQFQAARERNVGQAAVLGGTLSFTTFEPSDDVCNFEGSSNLYALNYTTGTASLAAVIGFDAGDVNNGDKEIEIMKDLGEGLVTTVSLHTGKGYKNKKSSEAITQGSTAVTQLSSQENKTAVNSGEVGWRIDP